MLVLSVFGNTINAQAVKKGDLIFDGYYGFVNLFNWAFKGTIGAVAENGTSSSMDHAGVRGEYLLIDKLGLGIDLDYNTVNVSYNSTTIDNGNTIVNNYKIGSQNLRSSATFNYHFSDSDKLDAYFGLGAGYNYRSYSYSSTEVGYSYKSSGSIFPVAFKLALGMRYFFTENIGANVAMGIGQGGLINGGICFKF